MNVGSRFNLPEAIAQYSKLMSLRRDMRQLSKPALAEKFDVTPSVIRTIDEMGRHPSVSDEDARLIVACLNERDAVQRELERMPSPEQIAAAQGMSLSYLRRVVGEAKSR